MSCSTNATPLGRRQRFQHHQQGQADGIGELDLMLGIVAFSAALDLVRRTEIERVFAPRLALPQHIEANARHHRRQPAAEIADVAGVGAAEPQPGFLHGVLGFAARAKHAVGDRPQAAAVGLELPGQRVFFVHRSHSFVALRHSYDERNPADVTGRGQHPSRSKICETFRRPSCKRE